MPPNWDRLVKFRNLDIYPIAKWAVVVIPVLATAMVVAQQNTKYHIEFPVNFLVTYGSAYLFFVACLLIDTTCPDPVKQHRTFDNYFSFMEARVDAIRKRTQASDDEERAIAEKLGVNAAESEETRAREALDALINIRTGSTFLEASERKWNDMIQGRPEVRAFITLLFAGAALLALYTTLWDAPRRVFKAGF